MDYIHTTEAELGINLDIPLSKQDPLDKLNDLANKKRKHADDIHNYFKANKMLKSSVQYKDHLPDFIDFPNTMLYTVQEIFFRLHQGPGLDDHARTFSSLLLAEINKRNLNPLKQMRVVEQLIQFEMLKFLQHQLFRSLEDWFQVLRRLGSIFTSVYAAVQKLKKAIDEVSSNDKEMVEVKVLMALANDESVDVGKESARNGERVHISIKKKNLRADQLTEDTSSSRKKDLVFIKSSSDDSNVPKLIVERPWFSKAKGLILPNHNTGRILPLGSQVNVTDSSVTD
ncbi:hypothetical protein Tco_0309372 [Tanacetum coccineum]